jgi:hypothetical protein
MAERPLPTGANLFVERCPSPCGARRHIVACLFGGHCIVTLLLFVVIVRQLLRYIVGYRLLLIRHIRYPYRIFSLPTYP